MKNFIIKQIYHSHLGLSDLNLEKNNLWKKLIEEVSNLFDQMKENFSTQHFSLFQKFEEAISLLHVEESESYYIEGFKAGLLLGIECGEIINT